MNDLQAIVTYRDYKAAFDAEIKASTESFVKIGFLLRKAMDTTILYESGYKDVYEFAQAEYRLDKSQVSRFININMRFSQGGYSPNLITEFEGYGPSKLAVMLQLPEGIIEQITPEYTREEITTIKEEVREELDNNTPIEVMAESTEDDILTAAIKYYLHKDPEMFAEVYDVIENALPGVWEHRLAEIFAPSGDAILVSRVPGKGKVTIKVREELPILLYSIVLDEKTEFTWADFEDACEKVVGEGLGYDTVEESWKAAYGEEYPIKEEPKETPEKKQEKKPEKKQPKVSVAKPAAKKPKTVQKEIKDIPEKPEENSPKEENGSGTASVAPEQLEKMRDQLLEEYKDDRSEYAEGAREGIQRMYKRVLAQIM